MEVRSLSSHRGWEIEALDFLIIAVQGNGPRKRRPGAVGEACTSQRDRGKVNWIKLKHF